jgi:hypothetical protein
VKKYDRVTIHGGRSLTTPTNLTIALLDEPHAGHAAHSLGTMRPRIIWFVVMLCVGTVENLLWRER